MRNNQERTYHHGDLRSAIIETALAYIKEGNSNFTLRSVARRAGVSHAAPYNHFKNKQELLVELAAIGFESLREALKNSATDVVNPKEVLLRHWKTYITFGISNPEHYRLMFGSALANSRHPRLISASNVLYDGLLNSLEYCVAEGLFASESIKSYATIIWSHLHGLTTLAIDGRLHWCNCNDDPIKLIENAIEVLFIGMKVVP